MCTKVVFHIYHFCYKKNLSTTFAYFFIIYLIGGRPNKIKWHPIYIYWKFCRSSCFLKLKFLAINFYPLLYLKFFEYLKKIVLSKPICEKRPIWKSRGEDFTEYGISLRTLRSDQSGSVIFEIFMIFLNFSQRTASYTCVGTIVRSFALYLTRNYFSYRFWWWCSHSTIARFTSSSTFFQNGILTTHYI